MLSIVLGSFLLVTAGLKIHGLYTDPYSQESILLTPRLLVAVIEIEVLLGLWLLSCLAQRAAWLAALVFFTLGTAANLYLAIEGQRSCGCFGRVEVSPWWTVGLDGIAVIALALFRALPGVASTSSAGLALLAKTALGAAGILAIITAAFLVVYNNPAGALAQLRGQPISVEPYSSDVGSGQPGESRIFNIKLTNHTEHTVRIIGGTSGCNCVAVDDLPVTLAPGEERYFKVRFRFRGGVGAFQQPFILVTDDRNQWGVIARLTGRVVQSVSH